MPCMPSKRGIAWRRPAAPRTRAGKIALLAVGVAATGGACAKMIWLLADLRPYLGSYWLLAVIAGIVAAIALPWIVLRGLNRSASRWAGALLVGYVCALGGGMRYYLMLRFRRPRSVPALLPPPPPWLVAEIAGLAAVALTFVAITLLLLAVSAEIIAPGPVGRRLRAWRGGRLRRARSSAALRPGPLDERFPARLRLERPDGQAGPWLRGAIHLRPGSVLWEPARRVHAVPAELASAIIAPAHGGRHVKGGRVLHLDAPTGRVQLECSGTMLAAFQRVAAQVADGPPAQIAVEDR